MYVVTNLLQGRDIGTRCIASGCEYIDLPLTGDPETDLDHEAFEKYKRQLCNDISNDLVWIRDGAAVRDLQRQQTPHARRRQQARQDTEAQDRESDFRG